MLTTLHLRLVRVASILSLAKRKSKEGLKEKRDINEIMKLNPPERPNVLQYGSPKINKRSQTMTLYHIGKRPASPKPAKKSYVDRFKADVLVMLTPVWEGVWAQHYKRGNVYQYKVPLNAIKEAGGVSDASDAQEVVFTEEVWNKYHLGKTFVKKLYDRNGAEAAFAAARAKTKRVTDIGKRKVDRGAPHYKESPQTVKKERARWARDLLQKMLRFDLVPDFPAPPGIRTGPSADILRYVNERDSYIPMVLVETTEDLQRLRDEGGDTGNAEKEFAQTLRWAGNLASIRHRSAGIFNSEFNKEFSSITSKLYKAIDNARDFLGDDVPNKVNSPFVF